MLVVLMNLCLFCRLQSDSAASAPAISETSSIDDVYTWATRGVVGGGAGLDVEDGNILKREKIDGAVLFNLTDAMLEKVGMVLGPRTKLLAAVKRIHPRGTRCSVAWVIFVF